MSTYYAVVKNGEDTFVVARDIAVLPMRNFVDYQQEPYYVCMESVLAEFPDGKMIGFYGRRDYAENAIKNGWV